MTTSHSSGRRHRGRRGRRSGNRGTAQQQAQVAQGSAETAQLESGSSPETTQVVPEQAPPPQQQPVPQSGRPRGDTRPQRPARRRQQPRQPIGPMPTEVLKRGTKIETPQFGLRTRPVAGMVGETNANFGCPMLNRVQTPLPTSGFQHGPRCSLGWSLHSEDEAMLCIYTAEVIDCWKAHPEKIEGLQAAIGEETDVPAAD